jgi:hypothetical protein
MLVFLIGSLDTTYYTNYTSCNTSRVLVSTTLRGEVAPASRIMFNVGVWRVTRNG